jgi:hypothetical protein
MQGGHQGVLLWGLRRAGLRGLHQGLHQGRHRAGRQGEHWGRLGVRLGLHRALKLLLGGEWRLQAGVGLRLALQQHQGALLRRQRQLLGQQHLQHSTAQRSAVKTAAIVQEL